MSKAIELANWLSDYHNIVDQYGHMLDIWGDFEGIEVELRRLADIEQAAIKLVKCKGRYHTEQNMVALAAFLGITLPPVGLVKVGGTEWLKIRMPIAKENE